jgi:hypothetical protein
MPQLPKPEYIGAFHGQTRTLTYRVKTGKRFPWKAPSGQTVWIPIKESRISLEWTWDANDRKWLTDIEWKRKYPAPNAGKFQVSKHSDLHKRLAERQRQQNRNLIKNQKK